MKDNAMVPILHAELYDMHGFLARIDGAPTFLDAATGTTIVIEDDMHTWLTTARPVEPALAATLWPQFHRRVGKEPPGAPPP